jgi:hypothetical protein
MSDATETTAIPTIANQGKPEYRALKGALNRVFGRKYASLRG